MRVLLLLTLAFGLLAIPTPSAASNDCGDLRSCVCVEGLPAYLEGCIVYRHVLDAVDPGPCTCDPINEVLP